MTLDKQLDAVTDGLFSLRDRPNMGRTDAIVSLERLEKYLRGLGAKCIACSRGCCYSVDCPNWRGKP